MIMNYAHVCFLNGYHPKELSKAEKKMFRLKTNLEKLQMSDFSIRKTNLVRD